MAWGSISSENPCDTWFNINDRLSRQNLAVRLCMFSIDQAHNAGTCAFGGEVRDEKVECLAGVIGTARYLIANVLLDRDQVHL